MPETTILIVEDEAIIAENLSNQLEHLGYKTLGIAPSREKAIQLISKKCPDLVLMDIRIKGDADGIDTAEEIKNDYGIPVIYTTAHADESFIKRAKMTEPFGYLLKPVDPKELERTIEISLYKAKIDKERQELIKELKDAISEVQTLSGLLPICAHCKNIRDDAGYWQKIELYIADRSDAQFSHSICPECMVRLYPDEDLYDD